MGIKKDFEKSKRQSQLDVGEFLAKFVQNKENAKLFFESVTSGNFDTLLEKIKAATKIGPKFLKPKIIPALLQIVRSISSGISDQKLATDLGVDIKFVTLIKTTLSTAYHFTHKPNAPQCDSTKKQSEYSQIATTIGDRAHEDLFKGVSINDAEKKLLEKVGDRFPCAHEFFACVTRLFKTHKIINQYSVRDLDEADINKAFEDISFTTSQIIVIKNGSRKLIINLETVKTALESGDIGNVPTTSGAVDHILCQTQIHKGSVCTEPTTENKVHPDATPAFMEGFCNSDEVGDALGISSQIFYASDFDGVY